MSMPVNMPMSMMDKAMAAWGKALPDWVQALAEACDESGLRKTAGKMHASPAIVSLAINNKREQLDFIKAKVEAHLMITMLPCPVLGIITRPECLQEQARPFSSANPQRVKLYQACHNGCLYFREPSAKEKKHVE